MEQRGAIWAVAAPLIVFKIWVVILLLWFAPTRAGIEYVVVTGWPWVLAIVALGFGPGLAWWRLVRVRRRREQLRRSEWMVDSPGTALKAPDQWPAWDAVSRSELPD